MQSFSALKKLLDNCRVVGCTDNASGRVMYDSSACISAILSQVAQGLKALVVSSAPEAPKNKTLKQILEHARTTGLADILCLCLETSGSSLISSSSNLLCAARESCRALCSLIDAHEVVSVNKNAYAFSLHAFRSFSLLRLNIRDHDHHSLVRTGSTEVVDAVTKAFLRSKDRLNIYGCTMDNKVWEHPEEWRLERFPDENNNSVDLYKMTTFGRGKRLALATTSNLNDKDGIEETFVLELQISFDLSFKCN
ncbi:hypothetical protein RJ639_035518 [Escallonia herrerae]|uniref:non-specific serine/threonine protein kinase n=1 Tax=Escallonia herrerae TaxID=1293975 RepID=A0AA89B967_9ASTE|nr:hypothetical protein RJ639_035518 [Escallonia herrerae]